MCIAASNKLKLQEKKPTHQHLKTYKYQGKINKTEQEILRVNFE